MTSPHACGATPSANSCTVSYPNACPGPTPASSNANTPAGTSNEPATAPGPSPQPPAPTPSTSSLIERYWDKLGGPQYSLKDATNPVSDFTSNSVSMFIVYPWAVSALQASPVWKDTEIVPLPQEDPAHPVTHVYGYYWMVNKTSAHQQAAWKFVNFLSSHPQEWLTDVGFVQPKKGWTDSPAAQKFPFLNVWLESQRVAQPGEQSPKMPQIRTILQNMIESMFSNGVSPADALKAANSQINAALGQ